MTFFLGTINFLIFPKMFQIFQPATNNLKILHPWVDQRSYLVVLHTLLSKVKVSRELGQLLEIERVNIEHKDNEDC